MLNTTGQFLQWQNPCLKKVLSGRALTTASYTSPGMAAKTGHANSPITSQSSNSFTTGNVTVNVFVTLALIATLAVGEFRPAAIIVLIMAVAGALESYTLDKTRKSIKNLLDLSPKTATIHRQGHDVVVPVTELQLGDLVLVKPGERIPVDGEVTAGASSVNQAPITGESMPVEKLKGSAVFSGTLNESGRLEIETEKVGEDTTLSRIVHLVQEAQGTRAPIQNLADRFTTWFLPAVVVLAFVAFFVTDDVKAAVAVLLVACPCAFAIATPTAVTAGVSNMARRAVLIKGGVFLELASKIDHLLVDNSVLRRLSSVFSCL